MNAIAAFSHAFQKLGYGKTVARNYRYADILESTAPLRTVALAVFTDTPFSYRNAAFGVLDDCADPERQVLSHRALGAPIWLCIQGDRVEVWNTKGPNGAVRETAYALDALDDLFTVKADMWSPDRIHRAKSAGLWDAPEQLSFFEHGLIKAIETCTQQRLDRIITRTLKTLATPLRAAALDYRRAYRACFYYVAAKIILDRQHPVAKDWPVDDAQGILNAISAHYRLGYATEPGKGIARQRLDSAWDALRNDVSFANISADDLAFVYENTLVSPETRKELGTHSTPRAVAEFLVSRLNLGRWGKDVPKIYEPFCGAGVLLVAALSKIRTQLPRDWSESQRHAFLVKRLRGADVDPFACEVASLSLILADYPSSNGWDIQTTDLFEDGAIASQLDPGMIVICNPPFESFIPLERRRYPAAASTSVRKPIHVLSAVLDRKPTALAFVMPHALIGDSQYATLRQRIEREFAHIEFVSLPDRVFVQSDFESALLVAREPRPERKQSVVTVQSATVTDQTRDYFLSGCHRPPFRKREIWSTPIQAAGQLWIPELAELWEYLAHYPKLGFIAEFHRGLEWQSGHQTQAVSRSQRSGFKPGVHSSANLRQFLTVVPAYLDCRRENLRGNAMKYPWDRPKVIVNAARKSRGAWRLAATRDTEGLVVSQQLAGCWSKHDGEAWLYAIEALLNSPLASAFVGIFDSRKRFRLEVLEDVPLPRHLDPAAWMPYVEEVERLTNAENPFRRQESASLTAALLRLDAAVLAAYELPARLERQLLAYFRGASRPVDGTFAGYPNEGGMARTLAEILERRFENSRGSWVSDVFQPLPKSERDAVAGYLA